MGAEPNGCGRCGLPERGHARQWTEDAGWHWWEPPSREQILARMAARRVARTSPTTKETR